MGRPNFEHFKKEALKDPETRAEYERLAPVWDLRKKMITLRLEKGMTQAEVAKKMGTNKSSISRLESGETVSFPTLATLSKYAKALDCRIKVDFESI
ncbi:helix-turn-helix domain-containing protein [Desulfotignum phosphitoxidans]|uniref:Transcriptional regulator, XRE family n=1 Tax=Desulfotignum phosphitoxidans DSM 13687 TaxID=1286635 RepID=S0FZJ8_9BACT|nr:helix-turn-helix transcriptional regulator [Desulfotignum phosphitoxidans]EMS77387.1 transcriptional regulator, XRE family [Desulfotignum phosphitoxidans DSM 13687]